MKLRQIAMRNIFRNRRRSLLSLTAIGVAALAITIMFSIIAGMRADLSYNLQTYYSGEIRVRHAEYSEHEHLGPLHLSIPEASRVTDRISQIDEAALVSPRIQFGGVVFREDTQQRMQGLGVDFTRERRYAELDSIVVAGAIPGEQGDEQGNEALVGVGLADAMDLDVGESFTILSTTKYRSSNAMTFTVSGLVQFPVAGLNQSTFMAPLDRIQYFLRMDDEVTEILVKTVDGADLDAVEERVRSAAGEVTGTPLDVRQWQEIGVTYSIIAMAATAYDIIALFFFILGSTVIINTTMMVIYERMREIGTLGAMGMTGGELVRLFFAEALYLAIAGSFAGVVAGSAITLVLGTVGIDLSSAMQGVSFEISNVLYPQLSLRSTVFVFVYAVVIAALASIIPSSRAARIQPVEALRAV